MRSSHCGGKPPKITFKKFSIKKPKKPVTNAVLRHELSKKHQKILTFYCPDLKTGSGIPETFKIGFLKYVGQKTQIIGCMNNKNSNFYFCLSFFRV